MKDQIIVTLSRFFLIIGILLGSIGPEVFADEVDGPTRSITLPLDPFSFQAGPGEEIANSYCIICHSADYIYMQPEHTEKKWKTIITKMQRVFGCPIPQDQIPILATYFFHQNSISPMRSTSSQ